MMKKMRLSFIILCLAGCIHAQTAVNPAAEKKELMHATWFESPRESSGDTITFRLTRHIHVPGKDDPSFTFSTITFDPEQNFTVESWRWCSKNPATYGGKWQLQSTVIKLDFVKQKCKCQLSILNVEKERLKVVIKEM
ncbi:MAG: hypothetical protein ACXVP0_16855 [Bacteroidia bacterium]